MNGQHSYALNFSQSEFLGILSITQTAFFSLVCDGAVFFEEVIITTSKDIELNFENATFKKGLSILTKNKVRLNISHATISGKLNICDLPNIELANFKKLKFASYTKEDCLIFKNNTVTNADFSESFLSNPTFNNTVFNENTSFDKACLLYSVFPGTGNFWNVKFLKDAYFNNTEINKGALFNGAEFYESALFIGVNKNIKTSADFSSVKFHKRSFFDHCNFDRIKFNNCEFGDIASFKYFVSEDLQISKAIFVKGADFLDAQIKSADRETFRIIKNEFLIINNQVEALHYRAKEMRAYEDEIKYKKQTTEYLLLQLNKLSNNHGLSWWKGIKFTVTVSILFYILYLISLENLPFKWGYTTWASYIQACGNVIEYFLRFFIITHDLDFMKLFQPNALSYLIDIIGKFFIGYGLYQTVQAFRKYGKT